MDRSKDRELLAHERLDMAKENELSLLLLRQQEDLSREKELIFREIMDLIKEKELIFKENMDLVREKEFFLPKMDFRNGNVFVAKAGKRITGSNYLCSPPTEVSRKEQIAQEPTEVAPQQPRS